MKIEEAIVYVMVKRNGGMTTDQIADAINRHRLHLRKDGQPVTRSRCMQQSAVSLKCSQKKLAESC
ncbi:hypothetical protein [Bacteroides finegoldii]|uniref:hypothetical protein n=1 Tax=Bacteroides finegoldii TaxID=338188 RepID=UPI001E3B9402|nr:hypothetical protein [Bacteroides finegoldii]